MLPEGKYTPGKGRLLVKRHDAERKQGGIVLVSPGEPDNIGTVVAVPEDDVDWSGRTVVWSRFDGVEIDIGTERHTVLKIDDVQLYTDPS